MTKFRYIAFFVGMFMCGNCMNAALADDGDTGIWCKMTCNRDLNGAGKDVDTASVWVCKDPTSGDYLKKRTCKCDKDGDRWLEDESDFVVDIQCPATREPVSLNAKDSAGTAVYIPIEGFCRKDADGETHRICLYDSVCFKADVPVPDPEPVVEEENPEWCGIKCNYDNRKEFACREIGAGGFIFEKKNTCIESDGHMMWHGEEDFVATTECLDGARGMSTTDSAGQMLGLMPADTQNASGKPTQYEAYNVNNLCMYQTGIVNNGYKTWCGITCAPSVLGNNDYDNIAETWTAEQTWACDKTFTWVFDLKNTCSCQGKECQWNDGDGVAYTADDCSQTIVDAKDFLKIYGVKGQAVDSAQKPLYVTPKTTVANRHVYKVENLCTYIPTTPNPEDVGVVELKHRQCVYKYAAFKRCENGCVAELNKAQEVLMSDVDDCDIAEVIRLAEEKDNKYNAEFAAIVNRECARPASECQDGKVVIDSQGQRVKNAIEKINSFFKVADGNLTVWRDEDGKFNTTRLISDATAGVVLGTVGGIVSGKVIKKKQLEKGFDVLHCDVGGQKMADYGDTFRVDFHR